MCVEGTVLVRPSFDQYFIRLMILWTDCRLSLNCRESVFPILGDKLLNGKESVMCQVLPVQAGNPCTLAAGELPVKARLDDTEYPRPTNAGYNKTLSQRSKLMEITVTELNILFWLINMTIFVLFWDRVLLWNPDWPGTYYVHELREILLLLFAKCWDQRSVTPYLAINIIFEHI